VAHYLYRELNFARVYYSPFYPIPGTPLEGREPENLQRAYRLYQADRLVAKYGFEPEELVFDSEGKLCLEVDPKEMWARLHPEVFPVEITKADPSLLMRVPGIGPLLAKRIVQARREGALRSVEDYIKLGRVQRKSLGYITVNGRSPMLKGAVLVPDFSQLRLPLVPSLNPQLKTSI